MRDEDVGLFKVANGGELFSEIWSGDIMANSVINYEDSTYKKVGKVPLIAQSTLSRLNQPTKRCRHGGNSNQQAR